MSTTRIAIEASNLGFHLCGSRFLGTHEPGSDWDYVVTHTPEVDTFLVEQGFVVMPHDTNRGRTYDSSYVVAVWEKIDGDEKVQVSAEVDSAYKRQIMLALKNCPPLRQLDKGLRGDRGRDLLWETLYELAGFEAVKPNDATPTPATAADVGF